MLKLLQSGFGIIAVALKNSWGGCELRILLELFSTLELDFVMVDDGVEYLNKYLNPT